MTEYSGFGSKLLWDFVKYIAQNAFLVDVGAPTFSVGVEKTDRVWTWGT